MNVSPYLKRRLRTLDEFLRAKGENIALFAQSGDALRRARGTSNGAEASDATRDRARLTLVSSTDEPHPAR